MLLRRMSKANPFDFNEDEATKQFEKNIIFGVSPHDSSYVSAHDFMKKSLAAANMLNDEEDDLSQITATNQAVGECNVLNCTLWQNLSTAVACYIIVYEFDCSLWHAVRLKNLSIYLLLFINILSKRVETKLIKYKQNKFIFLENGIIMALY